MLYAICGMVVYSARHLMPRTQFILGAVVLVVGTLIYLSTGLTMQFWPPEAVQELSDDLWRPPADAIAREGAAFQGGWLTQQQMRAAYSFDMHVFEMWFWGIGVREGDADWHGAAPMAGAHRGTDAVVLRGARRRRIGVRDWADRDRSHAQHRERLDAA